MTNTLDAEKRPAISGLIAPKPLVLALAPAPVLLALAPAPTHATTISLPTTPPTPSLRSQQCCKVHRTKVDHNIVSGANVYGTSYMYCGELTCLHQPCIRYRVYKKFALYSEAFGKGIDIFFGRLNINDINLAAKEVRKLFLKYLVLDCFDHIEYFASAPVNSLVNTSIFQTVKDYQMELITALEHHVVQQPNQSTSVLFDGKRVRHKNITINNPTKRVATIDGYYASPGPNIGTAIGKKVSFLPIHKVIWRVHPITNGITDVTQIIDVGYQAARTVYKKQIADLYDFDVI